MATTRSGINSGVVCGASFIGPIGSVGGVIGAEPSWQVSIYEGGFGPRLVDRGVRNAGDVTALSQEQGRESPGRSVHGDSARR